VGLSFSTIAGFNANGAMPHYRATPESHAVIEGDGLLLIDSGGQYLGGTTDITRVWPIGSVSAAMKRDYTLVLKGTMNLSRTRFPARHAVPMLDAWRARRCGPRASNSATAPATAWATSWRARRPAEHQQGRARRPHGDGARHDHQHRARRVPAGQWGVRIENLVLNVPANTPEAPLASSSEFETLTLCPIDTRCIDRSLLRADEVAWLNAYHATVRERLSPAGGCWSAPRPSEPPQRSACETVQRRRLSSGRRWPTSQGLRSGLSRRSEAPVKLCSAGGSPQADAGQLRRAFALA
jgi:Xaa-Pro aminopeptidase